MNAFAKLLAVLLLANFVFAVDTVVVSSDNDADSGAAQVAASRINASLVTVAWGDPDSGAASRIFSLNPKRVIIIGGSLAIPAELESRIRSNVPSVERINGEDRYETAAIIAEMFFANSSRIIVIQGDDIASIKAKIAEARDAGVPLVYVMKDGVPEKVKLKLKVLKARDADFEPSAETDEDTIREGLGNITARVHAVNKTQKASGQISEAEERIGEAREINITNSTNLAAQRMLAKAESELSLAKDSLAAGKPGEAFGQAVAAEAHAEAAIKLFTNHSVGWYKDEEDEVEDEIRAKGREKVRAEIEGEFNRTKVECERKKVNGNFTRVCTTETEREREDLKDKFEIKASVGTNGTVVKIELKFSSATSNASEVAQQILGKLSLSGQQVSDRLKLENETEDDLERKLEGKIEPKGNVTRVKFEFRFPLNATGRDGIISGVVSNLASLAAADVENALEQKTNGKKDREREAEKEDVEIEGFKFKPATVNIRAGDTVEWRNKDSVAHTITVTSAPAGGAFDSGSIAPGGIYARTFNSTGTYEYKCTPHPSMTGKVIVR